jgi:uncharacterized protein (TIGR00369 family)
LPETTRLDGGIGLSVVELGPDQAVLRLDPSPLALVDAEPRSFLHGGALATCVDTAGWHAVVETSPGSWIAVDLRCDFLRLAGSEPHRVTARCIRAGRTLALADVEIAVWDDATRVVALGRARYARTGGGS